METSPEDPVRLAYIQKAPEKTEYVEFISIVRLPGARWNGSRDPKRRDVPRASVCLVTGQLINGDPVLISRSVSRRFPAIPPGDAVIRMYCGSSIWPGT